MICSWRKKFFDSKKGTFSTITVMDLILSCFCFKSVEMNDSIICWKISLLREMLLSLLAQIFIGLGTFHRQKFHRRPISPNPISPTENFTDGKFHRRKSPPTENFTDGKFRRRKISPTENYTDNEKFTEWKILQQKKIIKLKKKTEKNHLNFSPKLLAMELIFLNENIV
jgi:hypothetical protein